MYGIRPRYPDSSDSHKATVMAYLTKLPYYGGVA